MIDTKEIGTGSYPQEPENKYKSYNFKVVALCELEGSVWAKSEEQAEELITNKEYEEKYLYDIKEIEEIIEVEEEE